MRAIIDETAWRDVLRAALEEDLGDAGEVSSAGLFGPDHGSVFRLIAKDDGVLCGLPVFSATFAAVDPDLAVESAFRDGDRLSRGTVVARVRGRTASILAAERTALNFVSQLSAVATKTKRFVDALAARAAGLRVRPPEILDTRKTVPGMRRLQKYAVAVGGGRNHRMGLHDMIMLKDNHVDAAGGIAPAVAASRAAWGRRFRLEVETRTLDEVAQALEAGADRIMLDNMDDRTVREAVRLVAGRAETEASGNMTLERLLGLADSGLDFVSFGELTHSVNVFDFSLKAERAR